MFKIIAIIKNEQHNDIFNCIFKEHKLQTTNYLTNSKYKHEIFICDEDKLKDPNKEEVMSLLCQPVHLCNTQIFSKEYIPRWKTWDTDSVWTKVANHKDIIVLVRTEVLANFLHYFASFVIQDDSKTSL